MTTEEIMAMRRALAEQDLCPVGEHKFVFLRSNYERIEGAYLSTYKRTDEFFCEKCLSKQEAITSEDSRGAPAWWQH